VLHGGKALLARRLQYLTGSQPRTKRPVSLSRSSVHRIEAGRLPVALPIMIQPVFQTVSVVRWVSL